MANVGAALIGSWFALLLCGIAIAQGYNYLNNCSDDNIWTVVLVLGTSVLNIFHTSFVCIAEYTYLVTSGNNLMGRLRAGWALVATIGVHIVLAAITLLFYTGICFHLLAEKKLRNPAIAFLLSVIVVHFSLGMATVVKMTKDTIQTLMCFFVSRGILTSIVAIIELLLLILSYHNLWFIASEYIVGGLYANSLLASINARRHLRKRMHGDPDSTPQAAPSPRMSIPLNVYHSSCSTDESDSGAKATPPNGGVKLGDVSLMRFRYFGSVALPWA
ncbi:hypothetical protein BC629DRAFT_1590639 [Irpex lacteus]|nr:hypothetical protein BC629DRAFT_1590639 [Irpex lacteus]